MTRLRLRGARLGAGLQDLRRALPGCRSGGLLRDGRLRRRQRTERERAGGLAAQELVEREARLVRVLLGVQARALLERVADLRLDDVAGDGLPGRLAALQELQVRADPLDRPAPDRLLGERGVELVVAAANLELEVLLGDSVARLARCDGGVRALDAGDDRSARVDRLPCRDLHPRLAQIRQGGVVAVRVEGGVDEVALDGDLQPLLGDGLALAGAEDLDLEGGQRQTEVRGARLGQGLLERERVLRENVLRENVLRERCPAAGERAARTSEGHAPGQESRPARHPGAESRSREVNGA